MQIWIMAKGLMLYMVYVLVCACIKSCVFCGYINVQRWFARRMYQSAPRERYMLKRYTDYRTFGERVVRRSLWDISLTTWRSRWCVLLIAYYSLFHRVSWWVDIASDICMGIYLTRYIYTYFVEYAIQNYFEMHRFSLVVGFSTRRGNLEGDFLHIYILRRKCKRL